MSHFQHSINLYDKPKQGNNFIRRHTIYNYTHRIAAVGGYDVASCSIAMRSLDEALVYMEQYIGNRVAVFVDNPDEPIWEGFINRMRFEFGGVAYTLSLDEMFNSIRLQWTNQTGALTFGTAGGNTTSQNIYGFKQGTVDVGFALTASPTRPDALRDLLVNQRAWPQSSIMPGGNSGLLRLDLLGFYHVLKWQLYTTLSSVAITFYNYITTLILPIVNNAPAFFDNTDFKEITNITTQTATGEPAKTLWDCLVAVQEAGNGSGSPMVLGITPTNPRTGKRRLYYRLASTAVEYTAQIRDGLRIRDLYGRPVRPWTVRPDRGVRIVDVNVGTGLPGDDPLTTYINNVDYDAERQTVRYQGFDDMTLEGAFNLKNGHQSWLGRPFKGRIRVS